MKIVIISKYLEQEDNIRNQLSAISENDSVIFIYSYSNAKEFILNQVEKNQESIDLIILYTTIKNEGANEFRDWLKTGDNRTFSKRDFNLKTIPMVLIVGEDENKNAFNGYGKVISDIGYDKLSLFINEFITPVKSWRTNILDEMDNLGIRLNSGEIDYTYYFSGDRKINISTNILSENFKLFPRKLSYQWLSINSKQIQKSIDEFIKLLKRSEKIGNKGEEKLFHKFLLSNDHFILRDNYSKYWYESKLEKGDNKYEEPDFTLRPNFKTKTDLSLIEIKLPNEGFIKNKKYHKSPYAKFVDHIIQVNDYKDYLESEQYKESINKIFGYIPLRIEYKLLIGRQQDKLENLSELTKIMRQLGQTTLQLLTYDDLMDYQVKFLDRVGLLEIK